MNSIKKYIQKLFVVLVGCFIMLQPVTQIFANSIENTNLESSQSETSEDNTSSLENNDDAVEGEAESSESTENNAVEKDSRVSAFAVGDVEVGTWADFVNAVNSDATNIILTADINATANLTISRGFKVTGNGYKMNMAARTFTLSSGTVLRTVEFENVEFTSTSGNIINGTTTTSREWAFIFSNITASISSTLVSAANSTVTFIEDGTTSTVSSGTSRMIQAKSLSFIGNGNVNLYTTTANVYYTTIADSAITVTGGMKVYAFSDTQNIFDIGAANATVKIDGEGTELFLEGNNSQRTDSGGLIVINGDNAKVNVTNGALFKSHSTKMGAIVLQSKNAEFNVDNHAKIQFIQETDSGYDRGATIRFRVSGASIFKATNNSQIEIVKNGGAGKASAVRMYGNDNAFIVDSGSIITIDNRGDGVAVNPGVDGVNGGVQFDTSTGDKATFDLKGEGSAIKITADYGPAIDMQTADALINIEEGTTFVASGQTRDANRAIFNSRGITVNVNKPKYYDFRNNRAGGGNIFSNTTGLFTSTQSDLSVWQNGADLEDDPYKSWTTIDYILSGANLASIDSTNVPTEFNTTTYGTTGVAAYSRMSGNNSNPQISLDSLREPTNADKYIYGSACVPEGFPDFEGNINCRAAWGDEVYIKVRQKNYNNGTLINDDTFTTLTLEEALEVYGDAAKNGMFKHALGDFAVTGDQYEIVAAWRGFAEEGNPRNHNATAADIEALQQTVIDKTPPTPVSVTNGPFYVGNTTLSGTSDEPGATVSVTINDVEQVQTATVQPDGTWTIEIPAMVKHQKIQVFLTDTAGNKNPTVTTPYHDAIFDGATIVMVQNSNPVITDATPVVSVSLGATLGSLTENMSAFDPDDGDITNLIIPTGTVNTNARGIYHVTYNVTDVDGGAAVPVTRTYVVDGKIIGDEYAIFADDYVIESSDVLANDEDQVINKANAYAVKLSDGITAGTVKVTDFAGYSKKAGKYNVSLTVQEDTTTNGTIQATVYTKINPTDKEAMDANDFAIGLNDVSAANFITYAGAKAYDITTLPGTEITPVTVTSSLPTTAGIHDVTFASPSGKTTVTVKAYIYDVVNPVDEEAMNAHDFAVSLSDVSAANFVTLAEAKAYDVSILPGIEVTPVAVTSTLPITTGTHDVTFASPSGKTTITVKAYVYDVVNPTDKEAMNAYDFAIALADVSASNFISNSNVKAYDLTTLPGAEVTPVSVTSTLPTTVGTHDVTFTSPSGKTTITVKAYVYDVVNPIDKEAMNANDFAISLADVSAANFINYAGAKAYDINTLPGTEVTPVSVISAMPTTIGMHNVTFASPSGKTTITVSVHVYDVVNQADKEAMNAHDFTIPLALVNASNFITYSEVKAFNITTLPGTEVTPVSVTSTLPTTVGTHDVTFTSPSGKTNITIKVTVVASNVTVTANDIVMSLLEAKTTTNADLLTRTNAAATTTNAGATTSVDIASTDVSKLTSLTTVPNTPIEITILGEDTAGDSATKTVFVYVYDSVNPDDKEAMNAHDFAISLSDVSAANFINYAEAKAYDISVLPGVEITPITVTSTLPTTTGTYDVTFASPTDKTIITVKAYVYDVVNPDDKEAMDANDFTIALSDISAANFVNAAGAKAYDVSVLPGTEVTPVTVTSTLPTTIGTHDVTFASPSGKTTITVKAYVYDVVNPADKEAMNAHDFTIPLGLVNQVNFINYAEAKAYDISALPGTEVTPVTVISVLPTTTGTHDVTFASPSGKTTITVKVTVVASNVTVTADDIVMSLAEAKVTSESDLLTRTNASAATTNAGATTTVSISLLDVTKITSLTDTTTVQISVKGTDSLGDVSEKTVNVYVYNVVNPTDKEAMNAHDFAIALTDVSATNFVNGAEAKAFDVSTLPGVEVTPVSVTSPLPTTIGTHDVTFASPSGKTSITVKVYVYDVVNPTDKEAMNAHDFSLPLALVSETNFINYAEAKAFDISTLPGTEVTPVSVTSSLPTTTGTHDVTFASPSGKTTITVKVTIVASNVTVTADDIVMSLAEAKVTSESDLLTRTNAAVTTTNVGATTSVNISSLDVTKLTSLTTVPTGAIEIVINGSDTSGDASQKVVNVYVYDVVNPVDKESMNANDFAIALTDVNAANFITASNVKAYDISVLPGVEVTPVTVTSVLPTTTGTHDVTFASPSGKTEVTVKAYVYDVVNPVDKESMDAHDFAIALADVSAANFITQSNVKAYDISVLPGTEVTPVSVTSPLPTTTGTHDVTFTSPSGKTTITVKAYVYNVVNQADKEAMDANNFTIPLALVNETNFIQYAGVKAYDIATLPGTEVTPVTVTSVLPTTTGTHDVTFTSPSGKTSITVKATVIASNVTVTANDIVMSLAEAQATTEADLLTKANAQATTLNPGATVSTSITATDVSKISSLTKGTSTPLQIVVHAQDTNNDSNQVTIKVYVYDTVNPTDKEAMNAHDFAIALPLVNNTNLITYADVKAFNITTLPGVEVTPVTVVSPLPTTIGTHDVTFASPSGKTTITVKAYVYNVVKPGDKEAMNAHNFAIALSDISETNFINAAEAKAYDISVLPGTEITPVSVTSPIPSTIGTYDVTFTSPTTKTTITVKAYVYDVVNPTDKEAMNAHDFTIPLALVNEANFISYAQAKAYNITTLPGSALTPLSVTSSLPSTVGLHDVTFASPSGNTTITVKANVIESNVTVTANDIVMTLLEAQNTTEAELITKTNATATTINAGATASVNIEATEVSKLTDLVTAPMSSIQLIINGQDTNGDVSQTSVNVYVYDAVNPADQEAMNATDFVIGLSDVSADNFISYAGAKAYDISVLPAVEITPVTVVSPIPSTTGIHNVTFASPTGKTTITVEAHIYDVVNPIDAMNAHDFAIALADVNEANFIQYAEAKAYDISTLPGVEVTPVTVTSAMPTTLGIHDVTFASPSGKTTLTVKAHIYDTVNPIDKEAMNANDFAIALTDVNAANFITQSNVKAYDIATLPGVEVTPVTVTSALPTTTGTHDVTFTSPSGKTSITVKAYVYDVVNPTDKEAMDANDFAIALADVNATNFITQSNVKAYDIATLPGVEVTPVTVTSALPTTIGTHDVTFTSPSGKTSITVKAYVYDVVNPTDKEAMNAFDFAIALTDVSAANFITQSNVKAYDIATLPGVEVTPVTVTSALPTTTGTHDVTFASPSGKTSITVKAYVYDVVNPTDKEAMNAFDFAIALTDVSAANFITQSNVKAYDISALPGVEVTPVSVTSTLPTTTGTHDVIFTSPSGNTTITVKAYVYDVVNPIDKEAMDANDFAIALTDVSAANFITQSNVKAYDISTLPGTEVTPVSVTSSIPTTVGTHDVTFTSPSGKTSITVKAYVYDVVNPTDKEAMNAHDFTIALADVNAANFISLSEVKAYDVSSLPATEVTPVSVTSTLPTTTGIHDVTFASPSGNTTITVKAYIYNVVNPGDSEAMNANDFAIALTDVSAANFITQSNVKAYDITTLPGVEVTPVTMTSVLPTTVGMHDVTFASPSGNTTITVKVHVYDVVNPGDSEAMNAFDFAIALTDISESNFIANSNVKAYDITTLPGTEVTPVSVTSTLPTTVGTHDVTFESPSGKTSITVKAYVYNVVNSSDKEAINAHDFTIPLSLVNETNFISYAEAKAYDITTLPGVEVTPISITSTLPTTTGTHNVTFASPSGKTTITIQVTVIDSNVTVTGNDIVMTLSEAQATTEADLLTRTNAGATTINAGATTSVSIEATQVSKLTTLTAVPNSAVEITINGNDTVGDSSTKDVKVYVYNTVNPIDKEAMNANDFAIALSDVNAANFISLSNVKAYDIATLPGTEVTPVSVTSIIPTTVGIHDVTFASPSGNTEITVKAHVYDVVNPSDKEAMNANSFAIALSDVSESNFINYAGAKAYDISVLPGTEITPVSVTSSMPSTLGVHNVTFASPSGKTTITVEAYIYDVVNPTDKEAMNASNFTIPLALVSEANFINYAGAKAYDVSGLPGTEVTPLSVTSTLPTIVGTHNVTFASPSGKTTITVEATIIESNVTVTADDIVMTLNEAQNTNESDLLARTNALATTLNAGATASTTITTIDIAKLTDLTAVPTATIQITIIGNDTVGDSSSKVVNVYVYDVINPIDKEAMNADDFVIALSDVSAANFITASNVKAYDISVLPGIEVVPVSITSALPTTTGTHDVTFASPSGNTTITVKAYVYDVVNPTDEEAMNAFDFAIALTDVSEANFMTLSNVKAYDISVLPGTEVTPVTMTSTLPTTLGMHDVTFASPSGKTTITVKVYVYDVVNPTDKEAMDAHDFTIPLALVSETNFINYAEAKAYDISALPGTEVTPLSLTTPLPTTTGTHSVTFASPSGKTTITVTATVISSNVTVTADDIVMSLVDAQNTNEAELITKTNATATTTNAGATATVNITSTEVAKLTDLVTVPNTPIQITINGEDTSGDVATKTVDVYVYDVINPTDEEAMNAHDFAIALSDVSETNFITAANAKAYDISVLPGVEVTPLTVITTLPTTVGTHDVTFASPSGNTTITVKAYVYNVVNPVDKEAMDAHDFAIALSQVNAGNFINLSGVKAYDISILPGVEVTPVSITSTLPTTVGTHDVTFASPSGNTTITVKAYVYDVVNPTDKEAMNANDFAIALTDVSAANFITTANAKAYDISVLPGVEVTPVTVTSVLPTATGTYDVTFASPSGKTAVTVKAYIYDVVNPTDKEAMDANDFAIALADVNATNFITQSNVKAYDIATLPGVEVTPVTVTSALPTTTGTHDVTFTSPSGKTTITVKAYVYDIVNPTDKEAMNAFDFAIALTDVSAANFITQSNVKAYDIATLPGTEVTPVTVTSALPTTTGTHDVTFTSPSGKTTITVKAYVYDVVNPTDKEAMDAHDFAIALTDVSASNFITQSNVKAYDIATLPGVEVTPVTVTSTLPTTTGVHDVTFTSPSGKTTITVKAYIYDVVNPTDKEAMNATNFTIPLALVSESNFITYSEVKAYDINTLPGTEVTPVTMTSTLPTTTGTHNVTFTSPSGKTTITVIATIVASNVTVTADDIVMTLSEAQNTNEADLITKTNASATTTNAGAAATVSVATSEVEKLTDLVTVPNSAVQITIDGQDTSGDASAKLINVYVFDTVNPVDKEAMNAFDFAIALADVSETNFISSANAKAYDISTLPGTEVTPLSVVSALPTTTGTHDVTFASPSGKTTVTVKAYVYDAVNPIDKEAMNADDFAIALADVSEANFISSANAKAYDISTLPGTEVTPLSVVSAIPTTIGTHDVTFASPSGKTTVTVKAYVYDVVNPTDKEAMDANDFTIALADVSETNFILAANAKAYDISVLPGTEVTPLSVTSVLPTTTGIHDVTFASPSGKTTVTVKAYIYDVVNPTDEEAMNANDFAIALADVSEANFITSANAKAYDISVLPGVEVTPLSVVSPLPTTVGTHDVTFASPSGNTTITVKAYVYDVVNPIDKEAMDAQDFTIALADVSETNFISAANAKAYDISTLPGTEVTPLSVVSPLPTTVGTHDVTFASPSGKTTVTVKAYIYNVVNPVDKEAMNANDFAIALADVNTANFITLSNVKAYDISVLPGVEITPVTVTSSIPTTIGVHDVTFTSPTGNTTITVKVHVYDVVNPTDNEAMDANDFTIALADVSTANFITEANAKAYDISVLPGVEVTPLTVTTSLPTTVGTHDVTFASPSGKTTVTVKAYVYDVVNPVDNEAMNANDFAIALADVSESNFITLSNVKAYDISVLPGVEITPVTVTSVMPSTAGTYDVTFASPSGKTTVTVKAYVYDVVNPVDNEAMNANDFAIALSDITEANLITAANAKAYDISVLPGVEITPVTVTSPLPTTTGVHDVTFTSPSGNTTITVKVYVYDVVNPIDNEAMNANDFAIALADVSETNFITLSNVKAYDISVLPGVEVTPVTVTSSMPTNAGTYDVTFTSPSTKTSVTVKAYVYDVVNPIDKEAMNANDFAIALADVNATNFITAANAKAYDITTLPGVEITPLSVTSTLPTTIGVHDVTFMSPTGNTTITVKAYVYNEVNQSDNEAMDAHDFVIALKDVNEANFITAADAKAYDITTLPGVEITPVTVTSALPTTTGTHDVVFVSPTGNTAIMVKAYVYDEVNLTDKEAMNAHDFVLPLSEVSVENFLSTSGVKAYDITTLPGVEITPVTLVTELPTTHGEYDVTFASPTGNTSITVKATIVDDRVRPNIVVTAEDIRLSVSEFNDLKQNNQLEEAILEKSNATATDVDTQIEHTPLHADINNLLVANIIEEKEHEVEISYEHTLTNVLEVNEEEEQVLTYSTTIKVVIEEEVTLIPGLPVTGENILIILLIGLVTFIISLLLLLRMSIYRRNRNQ